MPSVGKVVGTLFQGTEECLLIDFLPRGETFSVTHYVHTLQRLCRAFCDEPDEEKCCPSTQQCTTSHGISEGSGTIVKYGWDFVFYFV